MSSRLSNDSDIDEKTATNPAMKIAIAMATTINDSYSKHSYIQFQALIIVDTTTMIGCEAEFKLSRATNVTVISYSLALTLTKCSKVR